jgi:quercetin dioxygenase-like cupin family protein
MLALTRTTCLVTLLAAAAFAAAAQNPPLPAVQITPDQLTWGPYPAGGEQAFLVGNPSQPGPYAVRIRLPAGVRIPPHFHPDGRIVTVLSGTMYFAPGDRFDSTALHAFPAGSVWTETPELHHFAWAKDGPVVLQITGTGPSGMTLIPQTDTAFTSMQARGQMAMGVDQYTSSHVFEDLPDGGRIVLQRDHEDPAGAAAIRAHMDSIAVHFAAGDFSVPGFVHGETVPGTAVMAARKARIRYAVETLPRGAQVRITTQDAQALAAIHEFLAYQRTMHHAAAHEH